MIIIKYKKVFAVYKKELLETLRDKRTLILAILVPLLAYPLLTVGMMEVMSVGYSKLEDQVSQVAIQGQISAELEELINQEDKLELKVSKAPKEDLTKEKIHAYLEVKEAKLQEEVTIYYDSAVTKSQKAQSRLAGIVDDYQRLRREELLLEYDLNPELLDRVDVKTKNMAPPDKIGGSILGGIIPLLLIVTTVMGAMYPAIDLTAGEKERGTLETVLTLPINKFELLLGKYLTVTTIAIITALLNLASIMAVYSLGFVQMDQLAANIEFSLSISTILLLFLLLLPLVCFISAVILSISIFAKSFKEAQNYLSPVMLFFMLPAYIGIIPGVELNYLISVIPIANISLLFKEIFLAKLNWEYISLAFISNLTYSFLAIFIFAKLFNSEEILFAQGKGFNFSFKRKLIKERRVLDLSTAVLVYAIVMLLLFYGGSLLQLEYKLEGVLLTELLIILLPSLFFIWYLKADFKSSFNLRGFKVRDLIGSLLLWAGGFIIILYLSSLQSEFLPQMEDFSKGMSDLITGKNLFWALAVIALSPAICEELLFRGVLLSSFKDNSKKVVAVVMVSLLFGFFHLSIFRLLPTFLLGLILTYIVYQSGSIFLAMIVHFINNAIAVLNLIYPAEFTSIFAYLEQGVIANLLLFLFSFLTLILGVYLLKKKST